MGGSAGKSNEVSPSVAAEARSRSLISHLHVAGVEFVADPSGALFWPQERLLAVADLHFEKGSSYATRGVFLPPYDTATTLLRLLELISRYQPKAVVALGDSFHDAAASTRLSECDQSQIRALQAGRAWIWITGNHDPLPPAELEGDVLAELSVGKIRFRHAPEVGADAGEIAGHLHPVARVGGMGGSVRRRCFVSDGHRCILPAFGAFAGGLNLRDSVFSTLFRADPVAHILGRDRVYRVPHKVCLGD